MIRFLHGKEEPSKVCPSPKVWLRSSVVSSARLVFGRRGFQSGRSLNFFHVSLLQLLKLQLIQVYTRIVALHNFHPQVK